MEKQIRQLEEFHRAYGVAMNEPIGSVPTKGQSIRGKLQVEEAEEIQTAIEKGDLVEIADGVIDSIYIAIGTAVAYGFQHKLPALFDAVHRSNMSKLGPDGKPLYREDGKVIKGPNFKPPTEEIKRILGIE
ncbi:MAG TPA: nucleoside triphosphate pyrophosphohydrolase family protein [bacterium]|nr:nucleoside triphosphate pyrophosphohydrolase family protein [bacterium]